MNRTDLALTGGAGLAIVALLVPTTPAAADGATAPPSSQAVTGPSCEVRGVVPVAKGATLTSGAGGGRVLATFTGGPVPLVLRDFPADPSAARARASTTSSAGHLRVEGYVEAASVPTFTARDVSAVGPHVLLASAQKVRLVRGAPNTLSAEVVVAGSPGQTVRATAPCDAFTLTRGTSTPQEIDGHARGYLMKSSSLDLYDEPNGHVVFTLQKLEGTTSLFWSRERRGAFVRVGSRSDLVIDAWARARDLDPLKVGETMDRYLPPEKQVTGAKLALDPLPRVVTATREIPIRARRDLKEPAIGAVEVGAEVFVLDSVVGWVSVLPKSLGFLPPDDGGFYVPASEIAPK